MTTLDINVDDVGAQGDGIAHIGGATIFISGALKGEKVRIKLEENKNMVKRGELIEVLIPSSQRTQPPCPHFPTCGGCRFQHMNDLAYTEFKIEQLQQIFLREKLGVPPFLPAVVTATQTRRRARVAAKSMNGKIVIGFNEWRSHTIIDMTSCTVLKPELVDLIDQLRAYLPLWLKPGMECDVQLTSLPEGIDVVLIGGSKLGVAERQALAELAERLNIARLSWRKWDRSPIEPIAHRKALHARFGQTIIPFPPGSFLQATDAGEEALVTLAASHDKINLRVLDLFCGLGTFGLAFTLAGHVHFCDLDGPAISALAKTAKLTNRYETSIRNLIVDPFTAEECKPFDLIVFDPPRGGAKAQAKEIANSKVPVVIAISCDPPSFARDAKILIDGGYTLEKVLPVDQFLWSTHMELAAKFTR